MPYILLIVINAVFVNNFVLSRFLGICPFLGVSKRTETALGMGIAVIFVMGVASVITYAIDLALVAAGLEYLRTIVFTNCAVLGVAIMNVTELSEVNVLYAFVNGVASGIGFTIAILILAGIRERMETADIPAAFKGFPITLLAASIIAMSFAAFSALSF